MRGNRRHDTRPEIALRKELHRRGLRFYKHRRPIEDYRCEADLVFPRAKLAVFVDGCFWHGCVEHGSQPSSNATYWNTKIERNRARDRRNDAYLRSAGWRVVRGWEHEAPAEFAYRVIAALADVAHKGA